MISPQKFPGEGECSDARAIAIQGLPYKNPFAMNSMQQLVREG